MLNSLSRIGSFSLRNSFSSLEESQLSLRERFKKCAWEGEPREGLEELLSGVWSNEWQVEGSFCIDELRRSGKKEELLMLFHGSLMGFFDLGDGWIHPLLSMKEKKECCYASMEKGGLLPLMDWLDQLDRRGEEGAAEELKEAVLRWLDRWREKKLTPDLCWKGVEALGKKEGTARVLEIFYHLAHELAGGGAFLRGFSNGQLETLLTPEGKRSLFLGKGNGVCLGEWMIALAMKGRKRAVKNLKCASKENWWLVECVFPLLSDGEIEELWKTVDAEKQRELMEEFPSGDEDKALLAIYPWEECVPCEILLWVMERGRENAWESILPSLSRDQMRCLVPRLSEKQVSWALNHLVDQKVGDVAGSMTQEQREVHQHQLEGLGEEDFTYLEETLKVLEKEELSLRELNERRRKILKGSQKARRDKNRQKEWTESPGSDGGIKRWAENSSKAIQKIEEQIRAQPYVAGEESCDVWELLLNRCGLRTEKDYERFGLKNFGQEELSALTAEQVRGLEERLSQEPNQESAREVFFDSLNEWRERAPLKNPY